MNKEELKIIKEVLLTLTSSDCFISVKQEPDYRWIITNLVNLIVKETTQ